MPPQRRRGSTPSAAAAAGALAALLLGGLPAAAAGDFIGLYLVAQGGCSNTAASPLAFALAGSNLQAPFGKHVEDWSDADLAALGPALAACQAASAQAGNPYTLQEVRHQSDEVLARVPPLVAQARAKVEAEAQQVEARRQLAANRISKASQAKQQVMAAAETEVARLEREAAVAEADAHDAQQRLAGRVQRATRARDEARARAAAIAGIERRTDVDAGAQMHHDVEADKQRAAQVETQARDADQMVRAERAAVEKYVAGLHSGASVPSQHPQTPGTLAPVPNRIATAARGAKLQPAPGQQAAAVPTVTTDNYVACKMLSELITTTEAILRSDGDTGAALVNAGECFLIPRGTGVRVKAADAEADDPKVACVFIDGHPQCLWMPTNILAHAE